MSELHELKSCPVCDHPADSALAIDKGYVAELGEQFFFTVDMCNKCGTLFSRTRTDDSILYTPKFNFEAFHGHQQDPLEPLAPDVWNFSTKVLQVEEIVDCLAYSQDVSSANVRYLEVGASDGTLFRMLREEPSRTFKFGSACLVESTGGANACRAIPECEVYADRFEQAELRKKNYDIAVLSHCLEHFNNPKAVLRKVLECLSDSGLIYVEVPDGARCERSISLPLGYFHVLNFTLVTLTWIALELGLEIVSAVQRDHYPGIRLIARKAKRTSHLPRSDEVLAMSRIFGVSSLDLWRRSKVEALRKVKVALDRGETKRILVYGAGLHGAELVKYLQSLGWGPNFDLCDRNFDKVAVTGLEVLNPVELDFSVYDRVIVSSYAYQSEISHVCLQRGVREGSLVRLYDAPFSYVP